SDGVARLDGAAPRLASHGPFASSLRALELAQRGRPTQRHGRPHVAFEAPGPGLIELPPPQTRTGRPCAQAPPLFEPELLPATATPIEDSLVSLQPVSLELAHPPELRRRVRQLLA